MQLEVPFTPHILFHLHLLHMPGRLAHCPPFPSAPPLLHSFAYETREADIMSRPPRNAHTDHLVDVPLLLFTYLHIGVLQVGGWVCFEGIGVCICGACMCCIWQLCALLRTRCEHPRHALPGTPDRQAGTVQQLSCYTVDQSRQCLLLIYMPASSRYITCVYIHAHTYIHAHVTYDNHIMVLLSQEATIDPILKCQWPQHFTCALYFGMVFPSDFL